MWKLKNSTLTPVIFTKSCLCKMLYGNEILSWSRVVVCKFIDNTTNNQNKSWPGLYVLLFTVFAIWLNWLHEIFLKCKSKILMILCKILGAIYILRATNYSVSYSHCILQCVNFCSSEIAVLYSYNVDFISSDWFLASICMMAIFVIKYSESLIDIQ